MTQISEETEKSVTEQQNVQVTLSWPDAVRLRMTLPWLLRALEDRPTVSPRHRERRRTAHEALEPLLGALSGQLEQPEAEPLNP